MPPILKVPLVTDLLQQKSIVSRRREEAIDREHETAVDHHLATTTGWSPAI